VSVDYFVLDLETANPDYASICQIGLVEVKADEVVAETSLLLDPDDYFDPFNVRIHGITHGRVEGSPHFNQIAPALASRLSRAIVVHHGPFDKIALDRACEKYNLAAIDANWLDSQRVVRRAWPEFARSGYSLANLAVHFGLTFRHHDALEDAKVTAAIFRRALVETQMSPTQWVECAARPIGGTTSAARAGVHDRPFSGGTIVFTGTLPIPRRVAADVAQAMGFEVQSTVSMNTKVLCVGMQDRDRLAGYDKSEKHRRAEMLIMQGHQLQIISETDFLALAKEFLRRVGSNTPVG
jgi:DNA polymerase-3 subunit epsilon